MSWELTGNQNTNPAANFLGTTDNQPLSIRTNNVERLRIDAKGNIGIGTATPTFKFDISGDMAIRGNLIVGAGGSTILKVCHIDGKHWQNDDADALRLNWGTQKPVLVGGGVPNANTPLTVYGDTNISGNLTVGAGGKGTVIKVCHIDGKDWQSDDVDALRLNWGTQKPVMIGGGAPDTNTPLEVYGDVTVTGDIVLPGADCAEDFEIVGLETASAGTIMIIDQTGALCQCTDAYDKRVAGVISGAGNLRPGLTLGRQATKDNYQPLALVGRVYCKVDAQFGAIEVGDLLTTSLTPGHAMKAADPAKAFGAVIGKALGSLAAGKGLIPIIVALQ